MQKIKSIRLDCDEDVLLLEVEQVGGIACHTGRHSCFFQKLDGAKWIAADPVLKIPRTFTRTRVFPVTDTDILRRLGAVIAQRRRADPSSSYVASLFAKGEDAIMKKVAEEAAETLLAAKEG